MPELLKMFAPEPPALRTVPPIESVALPSKPLFKMPPPVVAELPLKVLLVIVSVA